MWNQKQSKGRLTLEKKLLMVMIPLMIVSLLVVSFIIYFVAKRNIREKAAEYIQQYLVQLSTSIDNKLETTIKLNAQLSVNAQLSEILQKYHTADSNTRMAYREDVENIFVTIVSIYSDVKDIYIFDDYGNEFYMRSRSGWDAASLKEKDWYNKALEKEGSYVVFLDKKEGEDRETTIGIARSIVNIYSRESYGVALIEIPYSILEDGIYGARQQADLEQGSVAIEDEQGNLIYSSQPAGEAWDAADGTEMIQLVYQSEKTGWKYMYFCEMEYLMQDMIYIRVVITILLVIMSAVTACIITVFSYRTFRPLGKLVSAMQTVQKGDYMVQVEVRSRDEIHYLAQTFNEMAASIRELIQKVYHAQLMQKEAQLEVLQQQINPHFLYNTFETMRGLALAEHNEKLADMVKNMSQFLRYNMYGSEGITTLKNEVSHITSYIRIMDFRFDDQIRMSMELPEDMLRLAIPKFTLQPVVENAVLHGFQEKRQNCRIVLTGAVEEDTAVIRVADNGCGIEQDRLEKLNADLQALMEPDPKDDGRVRIGIFNVNSRLKLNYGPAYGICLESRWGEGTTAVIRFPLQTMAEREPGRSGKEADGL